MRGTSRTVAGTLVLALTACGGAERPPLAAEAPAAAAPLSAPRPAPAPPKPHYALRDGYRYGYERKPSPNEVDSGARAVPMLMVGYNGLRKGGHQIMPLTEEIVRSTGNPRQRMVAFEWKPGEQFVKQTVFRDGKLVEKDFIRLVPGSVIELAMQDAERGMLERYVHTTTDKRKVWVHCDDEGCGSEPIPKAALPVAAPNIGKIGPK